MDNEYIGKFLRNGYLIIATGSWMIMLGKTEAQWLGFACLLSYPVSYARCIQNDKTENPVNFYQSSFPLILFLRGITPYS